MSQPNQTSNAFIAASWVALIVGFIAFIAGLWNAPMSFNDKGFYFVTLLFGLFAAISIQKSVRDRQENIPVTGLYYGICWFSELVAITLLVVALFNAQMSASEKGFFGMAFTLTLFAAIAVQKNTRDSASRYEA